jgi:hypothetical protein
LTIRSGAFAFLFPAAVVGFIVLCFVDPQKATLECRLYLETEARELYHKTEAEIREAEALRLSKSVKGGTTVVEGLGAVPA